LGELANAGAVRRILAFVYDSIGDPVRAWKLRMAALRGVGRRSNLPLIKAVASIAEDAMHRGNWHGAASFLALEIGIARRLQNDVQLADALLIRAAVRNELHDRSGANGDIAEAEAAGGRSKDAAYRDYIHFREQVVRAMLTPSAAEANRLLSEAIAFQSTKGDRLYLPALFLQRARALRSSGDRTGAAADLQQGMTELETHRQSLPPGESRWGAFHGAEELFEDAIDLAIQQNDAVLAFTIAERARARSLIDSYGRSPSIDYRRLPPDTTVVEYAALPTRLVIFTVNAAGVRAVSTSCDRKGLAAEIETWSRALRADNLPAQSAASRRTALTLYRQLLDPLERELVRAKTLAIIPDATTSTVPFSALIDSRGQYLIEHHTVVIAPSAAVFAAASDQARQLAAPRSLLVIANSEPDAELGALAFVNGEAQDVARAYAHSVRIPEDSAQFHELAKRGGDADVIHFAGHAIGDPGDLEPASIVLREQDHERRVRVPELASLRLRHTSVVVLAGCNTARGERRSSEGVISVAHGFLTAGAPSVIATLWPIDDRAAATLFPRLHQRLAAGLKPAEALREVQLEAIHRGDVPASLWAALQDIGS
ncbi:MAG: CHAT domain-containing protein, partial [Acidobacteriota bacterium]